jgi:hypothetical protein
MKNCVVLPVEYEEIRVDVPLILQAGLPFWESEQKESG